MRVFFVVPNSKGDVLLKPSSPHNGTAYLASTLLHNGHTVKVLDMRLDYTDEDLFKRLSDFKPDLVAITMTSREFLNIYKLVNKVKRHGYKVIVGGPHPSTIGAKILEDTLADYACLGEGEFTLLELANGKKSSKIKGLIWRDKNKIVTNKPRPLIENLDEIPFPAFELFELDKYMDKKISMVTSRGCPYACTYCTMRFTMGMKFRARSPKNVVDEIEYWYKKGYCYFAFVDDCFTYDMKRAENICDEILRRKLRIKWDLKNGIRVDKVNEVLLRKMKNAGCFFIAFGVESADQGILNKMKKGITVKMAEDAVRLAKKVGIKDVSGFFIIGMPGDNLMNFRKTLDFALSLPFDEIRFYNAVPYPNTELFSWIRKNANLLGSPDNYLNNASRWDSKPIFETPDFSRQERQNAFELAQEYVMKYLMRVEFGSFVGYLAWLVWKPRLTRPFVMSVGKKGWTLLRHLRKG
ncbi:MAG: radical SAM protein [Candidatus Woesearchaeota archaeon]